MSDDRQMLLTMLRSLAALAKELPFKAKMTIEWDDAPPDLLLLIAEFKGAVLRSTEKGDEERHEAAWGNGSFGLRARLSAPRTPQSTNPILTLVK